MSNLPIAGCPGCSTSAGLYGCPEHGRSSYGTPPPHVHDYQPYPHVAGPQRIYCRTCGHVIDIERSAAMRETGR